MTVKMHNFRKNKLFKSDKLSSIGQVVKIITT